MSSTVEPVDRGRSRLRPERYSDVQHRTIDVSSELFAEHGVQGTSFAKIADRLGVTKGAIYHQFKSKDAIVLAVAEVGLAPLEDALDEADAQDSIALGRAVLLRRVIDLAVTRRRWGERAPG